MELPVSPNLNFFLQQTKTTVFGWKKDLFEQVQDIPKESLLSLISITKKYEASFLLNRSYIQIQLQEDGKVSLSLSEERKSSGFYLSSSMPEIKEDYTVQVNLFTALLDFLAEEHQQSSSEQLNIYKRVYGKYTNQKTPSVEAVLIVNSPSQPSPLVFHFSIEGVTGDMGFSVTLENQEFLKHILENQSGLDLKQEALNLSGFSLGDRIYLQNQNLLFGGAVVVYIPKNGGKPLKAIMKYTNEKEIATPYQAGWDTIFSYQKSEYISVMGLDFYIKPLFLKKEIEGLEGLYDTYEIESIVVNGTSFFTKINHLCQIPSFELEMGMSYSSFIQKLIREVTEAGKIKEDSFVLVEEQPAVTPEVSVEDEGSVSVPEEQPAVTPGVSVEDGSAFTACPYLSPQPALSSTLKRDYFFPNHGMALSFVNGELFSLRIYQLPLGKLEEKEDSSER